MPEQHAQWTQKSTQTSGQRQPLSPLRLLPSCAAGRGHAALQAPGTGPDPTHRVVLLQTFCTTDMRLYVPNVHLSLHVQVIETAISSNPNRVAPFYEQHFLAATSGKRSSRVADH